MTVLPATATQLVGREVELSLLRSRLEAAAAGNGAVVTVRGEPGLGKTALISELIREATEFTVLRCRGVETEAELPFSGLHELLMPLLADAATLPDEQRSALQAALSMVTPEPASVVHASMAALTLIAAAATTQPVLLVADDIHWMDEPTMVVLAFVARRIAHDRVLIVTAERPDAPANGPLAETLELQPLTAAAVASLATQLAMEPMVGRAGDALADATGGNPLAVIETVRLLGTKLNRLGTVLDEPLPPGALIERGFASRLAGLPAETREALAVVATAFTDSAEIVTRALDHLNLPAGALDPAERAGVTVRQLDSVRFAHPLLRSLVFHRAAPDDRRRFHAALAAVTSDRGVRAWHAASACAKADAAVADELAAAAADCRTRGGIVASGQALERAARLTPDRLLRAERLLHAAQAARRSGRAPWASSLLDEALDLTDRDRSKALTIEIEAQQLVIDAHAGSYDGLLAAQLELADAAERADPDVACETRTDVAYEGVLLRDSSLALRSMDQAETFAGGASPSVRHDHAVIAALTLIATGRAPTEGIARLRDAVTTQLDRGVEWGPQNTDILAAEHLWPFGEEQLSLALTARMIPAARQSGELVALIGGLGVESSVRLRAGDWAGAEAQLEQALQLSEVQGVEWYRAAIGVRLTYVRALQGDDRALVMPAPLRNASEGYRRPFDDHLGTAAGLYYLGHGDAEQAATCLERVAAPFLAGSMDGPTVVPWPAEIVEAFGLAGHHAAAVTHHQQFRARWSAISTPWSRAVDARLAGLLADDRSYPGEFDRALQEHATFTAPFELARTHLHYGRRLRRSGKRAEAGTQLTAALTLFEQLGAQSWARQASNELSAAGAARQPSSGAAQLTSQERLVAECVTRGMTNKEAAAHLFLTPKTIEWHLRQIYRKLGIKSRVQLAAYVRESDQLASSGPVLPT